MRSIRQILAVRRSMRAYIFLAATIVALSLSGCSGPNFKATSATGSSSSSASGTGSSTSSLNVTPQQTSVRLGEADEIKASTPGGTWSVEGGAANGTIDSNGNYTAPPALPSNARVTIGYQLNNQTASTSISLLNPAPTLANVSPANLTTQTTTVTASGTGFVPSSRILLNGAALPTTFVDSSHLSTVITVSNSLSSDLNVTVSNPDPGASVSSPFPLSFGLNVMTVTPAVLSGGNITIKAYSPTLNGHVHLAINGHDMIGVVPPQPDLTTTSIGYLPPWQTGSATVSLRDDKTEALFASVQVPIAPTAIPFDVAARFATQAAFGPNVNVIQHIQSVGLSAFVDEQLAQPPVTLIDPRDSVASFIDYAIDGNSLLRQRVAIGLQSYIPGEAWAHSFVQGVPWEAKLEADAFGNYRQILLDALGDANVAGALNLPGSVASNDPNVHPNQNFAREIMQQFSMGPNLLNEDGTLVLDASGNPIPNYDDNTIIDASRMLTGWNYGPLSSPDFTFYYVDYSQPLVANESLHDTGPKTLFGNIHIPAGQTAEEDRASFVDAIVSQPSTAPFVSHILIQRLVKSNPTPAYIKRIAQVFRDNGHGISGDMAAVVRAILLDPEAREGDTNPQPDDGAFQDPILFQLFVQNAVHLSDTDDQENYIPQDLGESLWNPGSVFGYFSPGFMIPGTQINSPEFQLFTTPQVIGRSGALMWLLTSFNPHGTPPLETNFPTLPQLIDALNHIVYHGTMPQYEQDAIQSYCSAIQDPNQRFLAAAFIALNSDHFSVVR